MQHKQFNPNEMFDYFIDNYYHFCTKRELWGAVEVLFIDSVMQNKEVIELYIGERYE